MVRLVASFLVAMVLTFPAMAQTACGDRGTFIEYLSGKFAEAPVAMGLSSQGHVVEVLASKDRSWTIIVTRPNGLSCVVAHGEAWHDVPLVLTGPAS